MIPLSSLAIIAALVSLLLLLLLPESAEAYVSTAPPGRVHRLDLRTSKRTRPLSATEPSNTRCDPCERITLESSVESDELDRREALFAMVGRVWAAGALPTAVVFPAQAREGDEAKIVLPNPIEGLYERNTKQCLQESLGNRECLVYASDGEALYQGRDNEVLLNKVRGAQKALTALPEYIENRQWSKVTGVMTGPMGELTKNMGQLAENKKPAQKQIQVVKQDLFAIQAAVDRKQGDKALQYYAAATKDLEAFFQTL